MKTVRLIRVETEEKQGTFGVLIIDGTAFCVTLEPYEFFNQKKLSCIPTGQYICRLYNSPRYGKTYQVCGVPDRTHILFHPGNTDNDTEGCILLGQYFGKLRTDRAILNSGNTFQEFLKIMNDECFKLTIKNEY